MANRFMSCCWACKWYRSDGVVQKCLMAMELESQNRELNINVMEVKCPPDSLQVSCGQGPRGLVLVGPLLGATLMIDWGQREWLNRATESLYYPPSKICLSWYQIIIAVGMLRGIYTVSVTCTYVDKGKNVPGREPLCDGPTMDSVRDIGRNSY